MFASALFLSAPAAAQSLIYTAPFPITSFFVSAGTNMYARVLGMPAISACGGSPTMAYVGETDSGAKAKIAALMAAFYGGKQVKLALEAVNFYGNGTMFCRIAELEVVG
jgi:hypothetical protein